MLYKFKSRAAADVIMLEANARQLLQIMGKTVTDSGIVTQAQIPGAIAALQAAVTDEQAMRKAAEPAVADEQSEQGEMTAVGLHQRAAPLLDMLRRSLAEGHDVTW